MHYNRVKKMYYTDQINEIMIAEQMDQVKLIGPSFARF